MASITLVGTSTSSLSFRVTGLDPSYNQTIRNVELKLYRASNNSLVATKTGTIPNLVTQSGTFAFTGLSSSTYYYIDVVISNIEGFPNVLLGGGNYLTDSPPPPPRPSNWSWTSTIVAGVILTLTATEWNNFTSKINAFRVYKSMSNYSFTSVSSGNVITANIINQAIIAINAISPLFNIPSVTADVTIITAKLFTDMRDILNSTQ